MRHLGPDDKAKFFCEWFLRDKIQEMRGPVVEMHIKQQTSCLLRMAACR